MSKKNAAVSGDTLSRLNRIKPATNFLFNLMFLILALACFLPIIFIFIISITDNNIIRSEGYQILVTAKTFSGSAYEYLWGQRQTILNALWVSVYVTVLGTILGVMLTSLMGYVLSRTEHKLNNFLTILVFIPMVFGGGMTASYVINSQVLHLSDTMWILILPLAVSSFNVTIARTFFRTTIPDGIIESAKIDGASQWTVFFRIILPISKPVLATIGLFLAFGYWNDWFQAKLYIRNDKLYSLQAMLDRMQQNLDYLTKNPTAMLATASDLKKNMPQESVRMAIAFVVAVPIACVYPFFQKYFISGLTVGAVKG
ncbi:MAG: carbohydrate ABC transporter permease [Oscillospiraceae bacterium]|jgi:putative aldouronate transport system permease protein|nr:carbohydrate ABC transporter permease [Oscillospiraceae bacterium]MCI8720727.1 carbohydrate ABC transporter permease [Oscillospiraceae bacterium]